MLDKTALFANSQVREELLDFTIEVANIDHAFWLKEICAVTLSSTVARETGIAGRTTESLQVKIKNGEAVIAFTADGRWAGFSLISSWDGGRYVSN